MLPRMRPPTTASWVKMSPSTSPSRPITTAFPARIVPRISPSMRTVPSVTRSPTMRIPGPMMDIDASPDVPRGVLGALAGLFAFPNAISYSGR